MPSFSKSSLIISAAFNCESGLLEQVTKTADFFPLMFSVLLKNVLMNGAGLPAQTGEPTSNISYLFTLVLHKLF